MKKIYRIIGVGLLSLGVFSQMTAQENELGVSLFGGVSGIKYQDSDLFGGNQFGFSVDYALKLDANWAVVLGVSGGVYKTKVVKEGYRNSYASFDTEGESFEFRYHADRFEETLEGNYLAIPVSFRYETTGHNNTQFYAQAGVKYSIYSKATSKVAWNNLITSGYFSQWDAELFDLDFMGFGNYPKVEQEQKLKLQDSFSVLAEVGVKQTIGNSNAFYIGVFADYDLGSGASDNAPLITHQSEGNVPLVFNSVLQERESDKYRLRPFYLGLKLRYAFGM